MNEEPEQAVEPVGQDSNPDGMRARLSEQAAKIRELEQQLANDTEEHREHTLAMAFASIGLDPDHGVGKAVAVTFDGEPHELAQFAEQEFGHVYDGPEHPMAKAIGDGQARLDHVGHAAGSVAMPDEVDILARAEASGDTATTMAIKARQLDRMLRP